MKDEASSPSGTAINEHPAPETLLAYRADQLTADDDDAIREHLAGCADCAGLVLELSAGEPAAGFESELSELDLERAWRRAQPHLLQQTSNPRPSRDRLPMPGSVLLAASLVLAVAVPLFFLRSGTNPDHEEVVPLVPLSASRSPRVLEPCTPLATGDGDWRLSLPVLDDLATSNYRVEILTMDGQPVTTRSVFGPTEAGFIVELSKTGLTAGRYLLYLIDGQPEESVLIERFCIEILDS